MRNFEWPAVSEFTFTSRNAEEACARGEQGERASRAKADKSLFGGWILRDALWSDSQLLLRFDDDMSLLVSIDVGGRADWQFPAPPGSCSQDHRIGARPSRFLFDGEPMDWNPSDMLAARVGQELKGVRPGKVWLRVYIGDLPPLLFWPFVERNTRKWFLYWTDINSD